MKKPDQYSSERPIKISEEYSEYSENISENIIDCDSLSLRDQRTVIFNLLYAMDSFEYQASLNSIADNFGKGFECNINLESSVFLTTQAIIDNREMLDEKLKPFLANWRFERISSCTRLILRLALWEFLQETLPVNVVINEAIELAKNFAEPDAYKFVNGILDSFVNNKN